jgi:hypothetical protein
MLMGEPVNLPWAVACLTIIIAPLVLLPAIILLSAAYGLRWAVQIAGRVAAEQEAGRYDLLALLPGGAYGLARAVTGACLHQNGSLQQIQSVGAWILRGFFALVLMLSFATLSPLVVSSSEIVAYPTFIALFYLGTLMAAAYVDHRHSVILAILVGMWIPTVARRRLDAAGGAFFVYLLLQVTAYLITVIGGFTVLPSVVRVFPMGAGVSTVVVAILRLALFFSVREAMIRVLWSVVQRELGAGLKVENINV